jgi:hypothetical protein
MRGDVYHIVVGLMTRVLGRGETHAATEEEDAVLALFDEHVSTREHSLRKEPGG